MNKLTTVEPQNVTRALEYFGLLPLTILLGNLKTNGLDINQFDKINLTCDKVLSAALRWLLDEILFPLRLSSFRRKILFRPQLRFS